MEDVQRPTQESVEAEAEVAAHLEAGTAPPPEPESEPKEMVWKKNCWVEK